MVVELGRRSLSSLSLSLSYYSHCFSLPHYSVCLSFFLRQSEKDNASASISEIVKIEIGGFCSEFLREEKRMLEADADNSKVINGGGFSQLQSCFGDCSSEEELTVLPRHTKVVVTGNNRTKSVLVGLQGVVKKAVGLGGWHWLVLTNGIEVKLQRNALSVIEAPTGNEEDDDIEVEHIQWNNPSHMISDDSLKTHKAKQRGYRSARLSQKTMCRALSCDSHSKRQSITPRANMKVDLSKLDMPALQRYIQHFNLVDALPNPSKEQLLDIVQRHFMAQEMDELQVIVGFVQAAKGMKKACRWKSKEHQKH